MIEQTGNICHGPPLGAEAGPGLADAALFFFLDVPSALAFVERFACGVILVRGRDDDQPA
jgi:hypothetical protein